MNKKTHSLTHSHGIYYDEEDTFLSREPSSEPDKMLIVCITLGRKSEQIMFNFYKYTYMLDVSFVFSLSSFTKHLNANKMNFMRSRTKAQHRHHPNKRATLTITHTDRSQKIATMAMTDAW